MKRRPRICDFLAYYLAAGLFFSSSLLLNLVCLFALALPGRDRLTQSLRSLLRRLFLTWIDLLEWLGIAKFDTPQASDGRAETGCVWIMNHPTILDGSFLLTFIANGTCIYKQDIAANPFYGCIARMANYIPNMGGPDMIRLAVDRLKRGEDIIVFPEGTRSTEMNAKAFKPGFALIAKRAKSPIKVLWSENPKDFMTRETAKWKPPSMPAAISIRLLAVVSPQEGESSHQLMTRVISIYENHLYLK